MKPPRDHGGWGDPLTAAVLVIMLALGWAWTASDVWAAVTTIFAAMR